MSNCNRSFTKSSGCATSVVKKPADKPAMASTVFDGSFEAAPAPTSISTSIPGSLLSSDPPITGTVASSSTRPLICRRLALLTSVGMILCLPSFVSFFSFLSDSCHRRSVTVPPVNLSNPRLTTRVDRRVDRRFCSFLLWRIPESDSDPRPCKTEGAFFSPRLAAEICTCSISI